MYIQALKYLLTWFRFSCNSRLVHNAGESCVNLTNPLFQSIIIGVVGFWGGVFVMGSVYLLMVLAKRVFKPEEADKSPAWSDDDKMSMIIMWYVCTFIPWYDNTQPQPLNLIDNMFMRIILIFWVVWLCTLLACSDCWVVTISYDHTLSERTHPRCDNNMWTWSDILWDHEMKKWSHSLSAAGYQESQTHNKYLDQSSSEEGWLTFCHLTHWHKTKYSSEWVRFADEL